MNRWHEIGIWAVIALVTLGACANAGSGEQAPAGNDNALRLRSSAFPNDGAIPAAYTCDGEDKSPPLSWAVPAASAQSLALIVDDPDAPVGTWVHWVLFNLPPTTIALPEDVPADASIAGGAVHGSNSWNQVGYGGPCPPKGSTHRYFFKLYALDTTLDLNPGASKSDVEQEIAGHILAQGQLVGRYGR
jgi:Raf kinase inhibitor-like YbhB/YbcL family protein